MITAEMLNQLFICWKDMLEAHKADRITVDAITGNKSHPVVYMNCWREGQGLCGGASFRWDGGLWYIYDPKEKQ